MKGRDRRFIIDRTLSETLPYQQSVPNQIPGKLIFIVRDAALLKDTSSRWYVSAYVHESKLKQNHNLIKRSLVFYW